jgi:hypothetical protein
MEKVALWLLGSQRNQAAAQALPHELLLERGDRRQPEKSLLQSYGYLKNIMPLS